MTFLCNDMIIKYLNELIGWKHTDLIKIIGRGFAPRSENCMNFSRTNTKDYDLLPFVCETGMIFVYLNRFSLFFTFLIFAPNLLSSRMFIKELKSLMLSNTINIVFVTYSFELELTDCPNVTDFPNALMLKNGCWLYLNPFENHHFELFHAAPILA